MVGHSKIRAFNRTFNKVAGLDCAWSNVFDAIHAGSEIQDVAVKLRAGRLVAEAMRL